MIWLLLALVAALLAGVGLVMSALAAAYRREHEEWQWHDPPLRAPRLSDTCPARARAIRSAGDTPRYSFRARRPRWP